MIEMSEQIFDVYWKGPYSIDQMGQFKDDPDAALYAIYSAHPLYGRDVLVYIGMTERGLATRFKEHEWWASVEAQPVQVHVAYIGRFTTWQEAESAEHYARPDDSTIKAVEGLLIYAHQPAYNVRSKQSAMAASNVRLFNTGLYGSLLPEVSGLYFVQGG